MKPARKLMRLFNQYLIARWWGKPSTASFWYLPEKVTLSTLQEASAQSAYPVDFRSKLGYPLQNDAGIIVLPYDPPAGQQVNPEAAFQYAIGLYDDGRPASLEKFLHYANWFAERQTPEGHWQYHFDWYGAKAPWHSALAQARGASVMIRAFEYTQDSSYRDRALLAFSQFMTPIGEGGYLHRFKEADCLYFEEYPAMPSGVINGFMSCLISLWDVNARLQVGWLLDLWRMGVVSLEKMLPYYSVGWWSLYDRDPASPVVNVNSPRYHRLETDYLQVLAVLTGSRILAEERQRRAAQYRRWLNRSRAVGIKVVRKVFYK